MMKVSIQKALVCTELLLVVVLSMLCDTTKGAVTMEELMNQLEQDVLFFRDEVRDYLSSFSDNDCSWLDSCQYANYDHCQSKFPASKCSASPFNTTSVISACSGCPTRVDSTVSTVRLPEDSTNYKTNNITKIRLYESICQTVGLDSRFQQYWKTISSNSGAKPWAMHYSSRDGVHRIYPASHTDDDSSGVCRNYDPRMRPWFSGASSARRNVVLLLDLSMQQGNRIENMKNAALRVIKATTIADNIAIITFNSTTIQRLGISSSDGFGSGFWPSTWSNRDLFARAVENLSQDGTSSTAINAKTFQDVLYNASELIKDSVIDCSTALLLFTDSVTIAMEAIDELQSKIKETESQYNSILVFAFAMSNDQIAYNNFTCTGSSFRSGLWSKITANEEIVPGLATYFEVFQVAHELQQSPSDRDNYVAWAEPYPYFEFGGNGTTISAPVYDSNGHLLGVVGIKYSLQDFQSTTGYNISKITTRAKQQQDQNGCPNFRCLSPRVFNFNDRKDTTLQCSTSSVALIDANNTNGTDNLDGCDNNFTISTSYLPRSSICCNANQDDCMDVSSTSPIWNNVDERGLSYIDRACCHKPKTTDRFLSDDSEQCFIDEENFDSNDNNTSIVINDNNNTVGSINNTTPSATEGQSETSKSNDIPIIVGSVVGGVAVLSIIGFLIHRKRNSAAINPPTTSSFTMPDPVQPSFKNKIPWDDE